MHRLPGLDLLRAIAIIWVMLFHSFLVGGLGPDWEWLSRYGWMGVDIFFVLSGFLIGSQLLRQLKDEGRVGLADFYARRAWRILPAFIVVLAAYVLFPLLREAPGLEDAWKFASFTLNLLIDYGHNQAFSHAWSLCVEEHFYLLFPLLAWGLSRRISMPGVLCLGAAVLVLGVLLRGATWLHWEALDASRSWFVERMYYPTWMRLDGLLVGVLLAALRVHRPEVWARLLQRSNGVLLLGLAVFAVALLLFRERTGLLANALGWPVLSLGVGLLVLAGASTSGLIGRWPLPGAGWLAGISYSLYLSHKIAFHLVESQLLPLLPLSGLAQFALYALASLLLGAGLHYLVERPFLQWRDARRRAAPAPAAQLV